MNFLPDYDNWKLDDGVKLLVVVGECCVCGGEICEGDEYYDVAGEIVCDECAMDYMRQFRKVGA